MTRIKTIYIFSLVLGLIIAGYPAYGENTNEHDTIIVIGSRHITSSEFRDMLATIRSGGDMIKILESFTPEGKTRIADKLIGERLFAMEASRLGLDSEPDIRKQIDTAVTHILANALEKKEINTLDLSEEGLNQFYMKNQSLFTTSRRYKARHIVTKTKNQAQMALKEIHSGRTFAEVATEYNIDSSKLKSGDLGWVMPGVMVKSFEDALFSLKEGQISDIVKTNFGFHIIKAEAVDEGTLRSFERVQDEVKNQIINQHLTQLRQMLEKKYPVQINKELLQKIK